MDYTICTTYMEYIIGTTCFNSIIGTWLYSYYEGWLLYIYYNTTMLKVDMIAAVAFFTYFLSSIITPRYVATYYTITTNERQERKYRL